MSATDALLDGRAAAEELMIDSCTISTVTRVYNPDTATYEDQPTTVYDGRCEVKLQNVQVEDKDRQGVQIAVQRVVLKLPISTSTGVAKGQTAVITACVNDPALVGRSYLVDALPAASFLTARRVPLLEQQ